MPIVVCYLKEPLDNLKRGKSSGWIPKTSHLVNSLQLIYTRRQLK